MTPGNGGYEPDGSPRVTQHPDDVVPDPGDKVTSVFVLVCVHSNGGEGIYGSTLPNGMLVNFVCSLPGVKDQMEEFARETGAYEKFAEQGGRMEWREFNFVSHEKLVHMEAAIEGGIQATRSALEENPTSQAQATLWLSLAQEACQSYKSPEGDHVYEMPDGRCIYCGKTDA